MFCPTARRCERTPFQKCVAKCFHDEKKRRKEEEEGETPPPPPEEGETPAPPPEEGENPAPPTPPTEEEKEQRREEDKAIWDQCVTQCRLEFPDEPEVPEAPVPEVPVTPPPEITPSPESQASEGEEGAEPNKGKGKGTKGKDDKVSEDHASGGAVEFAGYCDWCGGYGHRQRNCEARKAYNKQVLGEDPSTVGIIQQEGEICGINIAVGDDSSDGEVRQVF